MCGKGICDTIQPTDYSEKGINVTTVLNKLINEKGICVLNHLIFLNGKCVTTQQSDFFKRNICFSSTRAGNSLIFGEGPERIAHGCSFLVSDLSDLLTSLIFGERPE